MQSVYLTYNFVNPKSDEKSLLLPINSEITMRMWRQKVRDIHLAFSSSDRGLGSGQCTGLGFDHFSERLQTERNLLLLLLEISGRLSFYNHCNFLRGPL